MTKFWEDRPSGRVAAVGKIANGGGGGDKEEGARGKVYIQRGNIFGVVRFSMLKAGGQGGQAQW